MVGPTVDLSKSLCVLTWLVAFALLVWGTYGFFAWQRSIAAMVFLAWGVFGGAGAATMTVGRWVVINTNRVLTMLDAADARPLHVVGARRRGQEG